MMSARRCNLRNALQELLVIPSSPAVRVHAAGLKQPPRHACSAQYGSFRRDNEYVCNSLDSGRLMI
jgi:hypothetical protein